MPLWPGAITTSPPRASDSPGVPTARPQERGTPACKEGGCEPRPPPGRGPGEEADLRPMPMGRLVIMPG